MKKKTGAAVKPLDERLREALAYIETAADAVEQARRLVDAIELDVVLVVGDALEARAAAVATA
jgi:hypothetical protein